MTDLATRADRSRPVPEPARPDEGRRRNNPFGAAVLLGLLVLAAVFGGWPLLVVIGAITLMIFLHELGHYLTAKWAGMKVTEFFLGFGPRIWSFRRGETEYGIKPIPLGAYVKIVGMHNLDEYAPSDAERTYMSKKYWRRLSVVTAGSAMHFLQVLVLLFVLFAFVGVPGGAVDPDEQSWVVHQEVPSGEPAARAGVEAGDRLLTIDGEDVTNWPAFKAVVAARGGEEVETVLERGGEVVTLNVLLDERPHPETGVPSGFFGVGPSFPTETVGPVAAVPASVGAFGDLTVEIVKGLGRALSPSGLADLGSRVINAGDEEPAVVEEGTPGATPTSGARDDQDRPLSIIGVADLGADLVREDPGSFLFLLVVLNLFVGVFNLVPLLPLDGGHVALATYEKIRSMLRGGEPYHADVAKLLPLTYATVLLLVFVGASTVFLDIANPIEI